MTSPDSVGEVSVEIVADAKQLAKQLKDKVEKSFKDVDPGKGIRDKVKKSKPIPVPVTPEPDTKDLPEKTEEESKKTRTPKVPVGLDPLFEAFQRDVQRQLRALAKTIQAEVPVGADTDGLRRELAAELSAVAQQASVKVPVAVEDRQKLEAELRATLAGVSEKVKASVKVEPDTTGMPEKIEEAAERADPKVDVEVDVDVDRKGGLGRLKSLLGGLGGSGGGIGGLAAQFGDLSGSIQRSVGSAAQLGGSLVGALTSASGPVGVVISLLTVAAGAMAALAAAAVAAVPAITAVAGAAAAIPGALVGAGAAFGALSLGFKGISDAFKPKAGGGGGGAAVNQAKQIAAASRQVEAARRGIAAANRQVESSERALAAAHRGVEAAELRLADAQKRASQAQQAISRARAAAVESIEDLNRSLRGAQLAEEDAALGVEEALRVLNEAKLSGQIPDIKRADLAYRQALQTLEESQDATSDLSKETEEANRKGVEGSEQVQDAYRDQEEALQAVRDAQIGIIEANDSLKSAQDGVAAAMDGVKSAADGLTSAQEALAQAQQKVAGGAGGVAKEVIKLAPAAQKFVDAIKALKPAFEDLRLDVQQRLFAGLDKTVTNLGQAWIPALKKTLGSYADTFNGFFKDLGSSISTPKFIGDIQAGAEGARDMLGRVGGAITAKLVPAFGALARASAPFLRKLGDGLAKIVEKFSDWVLDGEKSGALADFFDRAADALGKIGETGYQVARIVGGVIAAITGADANTKKSALDSFNDALRDVADWLADPANQQKVRDFFNKLDDAVRAVGTGIGVVSGWVDTVSGWVDKFTAFGDGVNQKLADVATGFRELPGKISGFLSALPGRLATLFTNALNRVGYAVGYGLGVVTRFFRELPQKIYGFLGSLPGRISAIFDRVVANARGVAPRVQAGLQALSNLPAKIAGWLGSVGYRMYNVGQDLIRGLWNGITSMGSWLRDRVYNFAASVVNGFMSGFQINSPSKLMAKMVGVRLPEGISVGMDQGKPQLLRDAAAMAEEVAAAALPQIQDVGLGMGWEADAAIRGSLAVADQKQALLGWKTTASGDQLLDAIARLVDITYNSDVEAAFTRTRR